MGNAAHSPNSGRLTPGAADWLGTAWKTLELAARALEETAALEQPAPEPSGTVEFIDEWNQQDLGLVLLQRLPETLVQSPWLSNQQPLCQYLCGTYPTASMPPILRQRDSTSPSDSASQPDSTRRRDLRALDGLWTEVEHYLRNFPKLKR